MLEGKDLRIADLGCGTGASALYLAKALDAQVTAVDLFPEFVQELMDRARHLGMSQRITPLEASIDGLPFKSESFDAIWSEGAIYNIGFEAGVAAWRPFLKPGGVLAVSEITWITSERPAELEAHWQEHYPEIDTASAKMAVLEKNGFSPIGYFVLPESCWKENYYDPLQARFPALLEQYNHSEEALACIAAEEQEIQLYEKFKAYFSYGFYIARKVGT